MTLTETRPEQVQPPESQPAPAGSWLTTADHKKIGRLFMAGSLLFLVVAGAVGAVLRGELAEPGIAIVGDQYFRLFSLHATSAALLFLGPFWLGLATYLVPLQIGSPRLAFPRIQATALWLFLSGGVLVLVSYFIGDGPAAGGLTFSTPILTGSKEATDLWIGGLMMLGVASLLATVNFLTTILKLRTEGMTLARVPLFTWSVFCTSAVALLATPTYLAGLVLLYLDRHFGGAFFSSEGTDVIWQHLLWLFGRPDIYLLTLPALGAACDIVATHARRPLLGEPAARAAVAAFAALSIGAWAAGNDVASAIVVPTYSVLTALIAIPVGILALIWLGTLRFGRPRAHISLAFIGAALLLLLFGAANAGIAGLSDGVGSAWTTGNLHVIAFGPSLLLGVAALHHWAPKIWGRSVSATLGAGQLLLLTGGFLFLGLGSYLMGYDGGPWRVDDLTVSSWTNFSRIAAAGGVLVLLGVLALVAGLFKAARGDGALSGPDPYDGLTLEWATPQPIPAHNFDRVPVVRSSAPLEDVRTANGAPA